MAGNQIAYLAALAMLRDPNRVTWNPGKRPSDEELERMARRAADPRYMCSPWFREPRRYQR